jgi:hypothetical protein
MIVKSLFNSQTINLGGRDENDRWTADSHESTWRFDGFTQVKANGYLCCDVPNLDVTKPVFTVAVIYSTGDSFSHHANSSIELIHTTQDATLAHKIKHFIEDDYYKKDRQLDHDCYKNKADVDGVQFFTYPWKGYFERLSYVVVESGFIKENNV